MWKYIFSLLLLAVVFSSSAQTEEDLGLSEDLFSLDSLSKYRIRSITVNYNLMRMAENVLDKPRTSNEINAEMNIHKFFIVADFGTETTRRLDYSMDGTYWRAGLDVNLSSAWEEGQFIGLGLRYAQANFSDEGSVRRTLADDSELLVNLSNDDITAQWAELIFKIRGKIGGNIYTGYTMRYQFFLNYDPYPEALRPFDVPGYGKTRRPNSFQFDYYIGWRFSFK